MSVAVRVARASDLQAIVALERATPELPHWPIPAYERYVTAKEADGRAMFVAESAGGLTGFAAVAVVAGTEPIAELESLVVATSARRLGVGRELCRCVITWSQGRAPTMELEVRSESAGAIALYRSLGFRVTGNRAHYYRDPSDDALLMSLSL